MRLRDKIIKIRKNRFWMKLVKNMGFSLSGDAAASLINSLVLILIIRVIGDEQYGIMVLAQGYMLITSSVINFQSWQAIIKFGSVAIISKDYNSLASVIKTGTIIDIISAFAGTIIALIILPLVSKVMGWGDSLTVIAVIFSIEIVFQFSGVPIGILRLLDKFNLVAIQKVVAAMSRLLAVGIYYFFMGESLFNLVLLYVIANIFGHILLTLIAISEIKKVIPIKTIISRNTPYCGKDFFKFAGWTNFSSSMDIPVKHFDVFIVSLISIEMVAVYKVFKQIVDVLGKLTSPLSQAIMPQFSELIAKNKNKEGYGVVIKLRNIILIVMFPLSLVITIFSPFFLKVFFGQIYSDHFYILSVYLLIKSISLSYAALHPYFVALGYAKDNFKILLIANVVYMILALILTQYIGVIGVIMSYFVQFMTVIILKTMIIKNRIIRLQN